MADTRPDKPTPDYPLFAHANGQWAKKVKGKLRYYGAWADPDAALAKYLTEGNQTPQASSVPPSSTAAKPEKPRPDFPLYAHASGQWAKRVRRRVHYFGPWADPDAALNKWLDQKDDLLAGRTPRQLTDGLTVVALVNAFLSSKKSLVATGEIKQRSWDDYDTICNRIIAVLGPGRLVEDLRPTDFGHLRADFAKTHGPVALHSDITRARVLFNWAYRQDLIDRPVKYGDGFKKPSQKVLRVERVKNGQRMFTDTQIRNMIDGAGVQLRAMIYLGINCGFGNTDCALLPRSAVDLNAGWIEFPRPKTGIPRRCPLWVETVEALSAALEKRPTPKDTAHKDRLFVTKYHTTWEGKTVRDNPISKATVLVLKDLGIHRPGLSFYALRHTFQTIAEKSMDKDAARYIMGHVPAANDMSAVYNEDAPDDSRLLAVVNYVHDWLFPRSACKTQSPPTAKDGVVAVVVGWWISSA
jgi:integrase